MSAKDEFMKIQSSLEWNDFIKRFPGFKFDEESAAHFNKLARESAKNHGDTLENHGDPRTAFLSENKRN